MTRASIQASALSTQLSKILKLRAALSSLIIAGKQRLGESFPGMCTCRDIRIVNETFCEQRRNGSLSLDSG